MKKQSNLYMKYIVVASLVLLSVGGFFAVRAVLNDRKGEAIGVHQDNPYYTLRKNATTYQSEVYTELSDSFKEEPLDQGKISGLVVKNYVADFYTWTNKLRFNDIGGLQFVHEDVQSWVSAKALETFYHNMNYYLQNDGVEGTLEISSVEVVVKESSIELDDEEVPAYSVIAKWAYVPTEKVDLTNLQIEAEFTLVADSEGLFTIVEVLTLEKQ